MRLEAYMLTPYYILDLKLTCLHLTSYLYNDVITSNYSVN